MSSVFQQAEYERLQEGGSDSSDVDSLYEEEMTERTRQARTAPTVVAADDTARNHVTRQDTDRMTDAPSARRQYDTAELEAGPNGGFYNSHGDRNARRGERKHKTGATASRPPPPKEISLDKFMELTRTLQAQEDKREQEEAIAAAAREAQERQLRNQRWAEVKARMTARSSATPGVSLRSAEWDDALEEAEFEEEMYSGGGADRISVVRSRRGRGGASVPMAEDPLIDPEAGDERPLRRLVKREKLPWSVEFWHTAYNWFRWMILGMFYIRDLAEDPSGYYQKRKFD